MSNVNHPINIQMNTPTHINSAMANKQVEWYQTDSHQLYQKNLKENYKLLNEFGWIDKDIGYKFNSHGFRGEEFDSAPGVLFLGCSHTFGIGLPIESTWSHLISNALGLRNYNLGIGGGSNDTAFYLAQHWIPEIQPKVVIFASTERTRFELHTMHNTVEYFNVWHCPEEVAPFWKHWLGNDTNSEMNYLKNQLAIKQLCQQNNIKYFHAEISKIDEVDKARDLQHYGPKTHKRFASAILRKL